MRWFFPDAEVWARHLRLVPIFAIVPLSRATREAATQRGIMISVCVFVFELLVFVVGALLWDLVRASPAGLHYSFGYVIPWSAIDSAARRGTLVKFRAAVRANSAPVERQFHVSRRLVAALPEWLPDTHPIRVAIEGPEPRFKSGTETSWPIADGTCLRPDSNPWSLAGGLALCGGFLALAIFVLEGVLSGLYVVLALGLTFLVVREFLGTLGAYYLIEEQQLRFRANLTDGAMAWAEITKIDYRRGTAILTLRSARGKRLWLPTTVPGMPELARALLQRCPAAAITPTARTLLLDCADGFQPATFQQEVDWW